ncbi:MAG TPA: L,D-transpeptidase, partial [Actinomycetota bacterium]|nr:L,D-transpeptidase [Actinomycetota bacterium]
AAGSRRSDRRRRRPPGQPERCPAGSRQTASASHGCVRLPMQFADFLLDNAPVGQVVYVYGGPNGENPQPVLDEAPLPAPAAPAVAPAPDPAAPLPEPPVPAEPAVPPPDLLNGLLNPS